MVGSRVENDENDTDEESVSIKIIASTGKTFTASIRPSSQSVREFKEQIAGAAEVDADDQRLIYKGRALKDEQPLSYYGIEANTTVHLVRAVQAQPPPQQSSQQSSGGTLRAPGSGGNLTGLPMLPGLGGGDADPYGEMQRRLMSDPEAMMSLLNSPLTQSLMNNPEAVRSVIESNPRLRGVLEANPQLRHALSDPNVLREAFEVARSPARLREAMRHQDLALSQLENHPEGFRALRRMYEDVQSPLLDGIDDIASTPPANGAQQNQQQQQQQQSALPGNAPSGALPNPWARPQQPRPQQPRQQLGLQMFGQRPAPQGVTPQDDPAVLLQLLSRFNSSTAHLAPAQTPAPPPEPIIPPNPWAHIDPPAPAPVAADNQPPQQVATPSAQMQPSSSTETKLQQLVEMGFIDREANERALVRRFCLDRAIDVRLVSRRLFRMATLQLQSAGS